MLNNDSIRPVAKAAFEKSLQEKVEFISARCWPQNLRHYTNEINEIIRAGIRLGVADGCRELTEKEITSMIEVIEPLRVLGMSKETKEILVNTLTACASIKPDILITPEIR